MRRFSGCGCVGCLGLGFFVAMATLLVVAIPSPVALGLATAAAVAPVPLFVFLVLQLDRYEREPWRVLIAAFLWGALVATFVSAILNDLIGAIIAGAFGELLGELITASAVAPIVEETAKGCALLLLLVMLRREFDNVLDGIVYGSLVGIGFAMTENILYFGRVYLEGGLIGLGVLFYVRIILGGFGHALYTATTGAALGYARETGSRILAVVVPPLGYGLAILQHAAWNAIAGALLPSVLPELDPFLLLFVVMPLESLFLTGPGLVTLLLIALFAWRRESMVIRRHLAEEAAEGMLTPAEYEALPSQRARLGREIGAFRRRGIGGWLAERELHQVATKLAFRKWHLSRGERPTSAERLLSEDRARQQIAALRARAS
ncbi:MAG: PrsW family intramembrane metalloprotease [Chloroflexi bacterium]|nr:PrsW family intramembrane metalloprotease [Chloroflexota bacterium]